MINNYRFGEIIIDGKAYTSDVVIFPDRVNYSWWRREGHEICPDDLKEVFQAKPELLVVGKGNPGLMEILPETRRQLSNLGIKLIAESTYQACQIYNELCQSQRVVAALHLTC